jgi:V-type H+-transporting ATPase subunit d
MISFNADNGYLDGIVRGYKSALLTNIQYLNLIQCENLEGW